MEIVDGYVSIVGSLQRFTADHANMMRAKKGLPPRDDLEDLSPLGLRDLVRSQGVSAAYSICESVLGLREDWDQLMTDYAGTLDFFALIPSLSSNFASELDLLPELKAQGMKAVHFRPGKWKTPLHLNSPEFDAIYSSLSELSLPLFVMCGGITGPSIAYSDPSIMDDVANRYPDLRIVLTHGGWPFVQQMSGMLHRRSNVWCMPDAYFPGFPGWRSYLEAMETFGQNRFIFSSIFPYTDIDEHIESYRSLGVSDEILKKAFSTNMSQLFDFDIDIYSAGRTELPVSS